MITASTSRMAETVFWVLGAALLSLYFSTRAYGELERRQAIAAFAAPDQSSWSPSPSRAYAVAMTGRGDPELPVAVLRIGSLNVEVPVYTDSSEHNLNRGAGLIEGTALPGSDGNVAIAAHRDGYFRALRNAAIGDVIELESRADQKAYRITELAIVEPTELWPLDETDTPMVTLVTCYPFYFVGSAPQRFIVRAVAVD